MEKEIFGIYLLVYTMRGITLHPILHDISLLPRGTLTPFWEMNVANYVGKLTVEEMHCTPLPLITQQAEARMGQR